MRTSESKLAAAERACEQGYPEVALMILANRVRAYTRTPKTPAGWLVANWRDPYPRGTAAVVLVDAHETGRPEAFYVVPIDVIREIIRDDHHRVYPNGRPRNPDAGNAVVTPASVEQYRDAWEFYLPADEREELLVR